MYKNDRIDMHQAGYHIAAHVTASLFFPMKADKDRLIVHLLEVVCRRLVRVGGGTSATSCVVALSVYS